MDRPFSGKRALAQIQEISTVAIFSRKSKAILHPPIVFNNNNVIQATYQKHLCILLDTQLSFEKSLETVLSKHKQNYWSYA